MKNMIFTFVLFLPLFALLPNVNAAEVDVTWQDSDKYRDVYAGNGNNKKFKKTTFSNLEKHFNKLAKALPENNTLKIIVNDLDLAGDVHIGGINQIRIIKDIFAPRIEFSYQLLSADKQVILEDSVNLKDMNFMMRNSMKYNNSSLSYEKAMLDDWFKETFSEFTVK
ncbi:DUF3016 domain-containing protein [Thalassotalea profundi]|uniref:DUF3016 domain-containing protein n=1 Tax=Thalassotalea profundi TaxID=2036687 RepID=A0ABQ3J1A2_9GAMM|nr:DUF3016 domain-containing protein [Thalassotalea profundi]GHF00641.1 hypothetical protein GCM10011501_32610 [Thalassotalea profundi]